MGYQHRTQVTIIYIHTHTHTKLHISTYYYTCQHKNMSHPPQEGVTEVWHIAHFWVSYGRCTMPRLPMGQSEGLSRQWADKVAQVGTPRTMPLCMLLGLLWQSFHAWITYRSICRVILATPDHVTCGTISHM